MEVSHLTYFFATRKTDDKRRTLEPNHTILSLLLPLHARIKFPFPLLARAKDVLRIIAYFFTISQESVDFIMMTLLGKHVFDTRSFIIDLTENRAGPGMRRFVCELLRYTCLMLSQYIHSLGE